LAIGTSYATLALIKTRLAITDSTDDVALQAALDSATLDIEGICGRQFNDAGSATARVYYPDDLATVTVDDFSTVSGLIVAADFSNAGTYTSIIASGNYQVEPLNGIVDGTPGWPYYRIRAIQTWYPLWLTSVGFPRTSIQITAQWGWAAVPAPVILACLILAEELFKLKDAPYGVAGFDNYGAIRVRDNPKVMSLLGRYIRSPIQVA
jgi:Phage gp6-like head-tail connector protein